MIKPRHKQKLTLKSWQTGNVHCVPLIYTLNKADMENLSAARVIQIASIWSHLKNLKILALSAQNANRITLLKKNLGKVKFFTPAPGFQNVSIHFGIHPLIKNALNATRQYCYTKRQKRRVNKRFAPMKTVIFLSVLKLLDNEKSYPSMECYS